MNPRVEAAYHVYYTLFGTTTTFSYLSFNSPTNPISVNVTQFNSDYASGTFSGLIKDASAGVATVTNGEFYAKF